MTRKGLTLLTTVFITLSVRTENTKTLPRICKLIFSFIELFLKL